MASEKLLVERRGAVTLATINRPEVHNCIDAETADALTSTIESFAGDDDARVMVVTGAGGRAFCSGMDLRAGDEVLARATAAGGPPLGFADHDPGKPTIAAVEGHCLAGGLELACWCDWRVAGEGASFGVLNRRWGVPLVDGGTQRLPRIAGLGNALYLIETGALIGADRALRMGLVQEVVPAGGSLDRAVELAEAIAAYPQRSLVADRTQALAAHGRPLPEGLREEAAGVTSTVADPEMSEGLRRFVERERPDPPSGG
jgi:enoyl-CoA hydratase